jgi:hypothetical protein
MKYRVQQRNGDYKSRPFLRRTLHYRTFVRNLQGRNNHTSDIKMDLGEIWSADVDQIKLA